MVNELLFFCWKKRIQTGTQYARYSSAKPGWYSTEHASRNPARTRDSRRCFSENRIRQTIIRRRIATVWKLHEKKPKGT